MKRVLARKTQKAFLHICCKKSGSCIRKKECLFCKLYSDYAKYNFLENVETPHLVPRSGINGLEIVPRNTDLSVLVHTRIYNTIHPTMMNWWVAERFVNRQQAYLGEYLNKIKKRKKK